MADLDCSNALEKKHPRSEFSFFQSVPKKLVNALKFAKTHSSNPFQMASAVLRSTSFPSSRMRSQTRSTVSRGRHVEKRVRNHCIVKTLVRGGS